MSDRITNRIADLLEDRISATGDIKDLGADAPDMELDENGMHKSYWVLSEAERGKGFVRPVCRTYLHAGISGPQYPTRELNEKEVAMWGAPTDGEDFAVFEQYPQGSHGSGRYWTKNELAQVGKGCKGATTMSQPIAETYARDPHFYGSTFCVNCGGHYPVGERGEFVWDDGSRVGT